MSEEPTTTTETEARPLTPEARAKPRCRGTPVEIEGQTWLLADYVPWPEAVWDRLYDSNVLAGEYAPADVDAACSRLLWVNYDLPPATIANLLAEADRADLVRAVEAAMFVSDRVHRTYSEWVQCSLLINGIDPATVPPELTLRTMELLVEMKKTLPANEFISSVQAAASRNAWQSMIKNGL